MALVPCLAGCSGLVGGADGAPGASPADAWVDLFDGETLAGWRGYGRADVPAGWRVEDGAIRFVPGTGDGGDLVAEGTWGDFELEIDWRIAPCGNSGIFYRGQERPGGPVYQTAPEYQVLDDACHPDGQYPSHRTGAIYDLYVPTEVAARPAGEWNRTRIVARGSHVEHWLNGQQVAEAEMGSPDWDARVAASKFRNADAFPGFGTYREGVVAVQDHGDEVWYRNVRLRPLD